MCVYVIKQYLPHKHKQTIQLIGMVITFGNKNTIICICMSCMDGEWKTVVELIAFVRNSVSN